LITANFLHGGILHLLFNSFSLFQIGQVAEAEFGVVQTGLRAVDGDVPPGFGEHLWRHIHTDGATG
jgi:hypothetical protein